MSPTQVQFDALALCLEGSDPWAFMVGMASILGHPFYRGMWALEA